MRIDFISDISCPWCSLGLASLEKALSSLKDEINYELFFQPFELNVDMPREGKKLFDYLNEKYGMSAEMVATSHNQLRARGQAVGFEFGEREFIWNTFDAHRLLCWASLAGAPTLQRQLKHALMRAYHSMGLNPSDPQILLQLVEQVGLNPTEAKKILDSDQYSKEVRQLELEWHHLGINAVPSMVINRKHLLQGALPVENLVAALRQLNN